MIASKTQATCDGNTMLFRLIECARWKEQLVQIDLPARQENFLSEGAVRRSETTIHASAPDMMSHQTRVNAVHPKCEWVQQKHRWRIHSAALRQRPSH